MRINIPKYQAINLLNKRIQELNSYDYEPSAWRSKVHTDVEAIFGPGAKVVDIISLPLDTVYMEIQQKYRQDGKLKAKKMLEGYIDSINEHVPDAVANLVPARNPEQDLAILQAHTTIAKINADNEYLKTQFVQNNAEIESLKKSIWQLEGVNISILWKIFKSLKLTEQIAVSAFFLALFGIGFTIGAFFQKHHWLS